jgi:hypothetical protein
MFTRQIRAVRPRGIVVRGGWALRAVGGLIFAAVAASLTLGAVAQARLHAAKPHASKPRAVKGGPSRKRARRRSSIFRAPILRARDEVLEWTRMGRSSTYKLLIRAPGRREIVRVTGHTYRPAAIAGARVYFRVKAMARETTWSNPAAISYPRGDGEPLERPYGAEQSRQEGGTGQVKYRLDAASFFNPFAGAPYAPWVRAHVDLIKGYPAFADTFPGLFGLPVIGYHDPATEGQAPLGANEVEAYVAKVQRDVAHGYAGVFIDDANWSSPFPPSPGPPVNLAHLIEAVRVAAPHALIEVNSQFHDIWPLIQGGNPELARVLSDIDEVCVEYGVGPTSGINTPGEYAEFMRYADTLHSKGIGLTLTGDREHVDVPTMEYNLATYFLINDGRDHVNGTEQTPEHWWSGFNVNLGNALGRRDRLPSGLWIRKFTGGAVYTLEPGAATQTVNLGKTMHSAQWGSVSSITLSGGQGAVLTR